ncbi:hypothetical protein Tco_0615297 [Tanacetum coccineum]
MFDPHSLQCRRSSESSFSTFRIVLSIEDKLNYLEQPLPPAPVAPAGQQVAPEILAAHTAWLPSELEKSEDKQTNAKFSTLANRKKGRQLKRNVLSSFSLKLLKKKKNAYRTTQPLELVVQGLRASRKLKRALSLYVGNGQREAVEAIAFFIYVLPMIRDCFETMSIMPPSITRGSVRLLVKRDTLTKPDKLEPRSYKCIFKGYPRGNNGNSFYYLPREQSPCCSESELPRNSLITQEASGSLEDLEIIQEEDTHPSIDTKS